jgi:hypothetical protein
MMTGGGGFRFIGFGGGTGFAVKPTMPLPYPVGTVAGDLVVYVGDANGTAVPPSSTAGWSSAHSLGTGADIWWKIVTSADLALTVNNSSTACSYLTLAFRGALGAALRGSDYRPANNGTSTVTLSGFTKAVGSNALLLFSSQDIAGTRSISAPTLPNLVASNLIGGVYQLQAWVDVRPSEYTNLASFTFDFGTTTWSQRDAVMFELT